MARPVTGGDASPAVSSAGAADARPEVRAVVLLGGVLRPSRLSRSIGRALLDLPVGESQTMAEHWLEQCGACFGGGSAGGPEVIIQLDSQSEQPRLGEAARGLAVRVERDQRAYRGTAGVLRDLAGGFGDDDLLLVAGATQVLLEPLGEIVDALAGRPGLVSLLAHEDGTPSSISLLRCRAVNDLPEVGFVDLKEQVLPRLATEHRVRVASREVAAALPVRTRSSYIAALQRLHQPGESGPFREDWQSCFSIIEPGSEVDSGARIHDSVVLSGGRVEAGAVVVRSVVCPGAVVGRNRTVVDAVVTPRGTEGGKASE
ncbi:MAG: hypothetical protein ACLFVN_02340 [Phycisphaeraceae bacterium]